MRFIALSEPVISVPVDKITNSKKQLKVENGKWEIMNAEAIENDSLITFKSFMVKKISFAVC